MLTLVFPKHLRPLIEKAVIASLNLTQNSAMLRDNSDFFQSSWEDTSIPLAKQKSSNCCKNSEKKRKNSSFIETQQ